MPVRALFFLNYVDLTSLPFSRMLTLKVSRVPYHLFIRVMLFIGGNQIIIKCQFSQNISFIFDVYWYGAGRQARQRRNKSSKVNSQSCESQIRYGTISVYIMHVQNQPIRTCTLFNCSLVVFFLTFKFRKELNHTNSINLNTRNVSVLWFQVL